MHIDTTWKFREMISFRDETARRLGFDLSRLRHPKGLYKKAAEGKIPNFTGIGSPYAAPENPFTSRLYPLTIPYGYGEIWHRPGLELRQRAMVSLAGFTALQLQDQLTKFAQSAQNVGLSVDEVCEAIIQTSPYSGYAPALNALRWLGEVSP